MGTARAVVAESTSCPACNARVSNPYSRSSIFWSVIVAPFGRSSLQLSAFAYERLYRFCQFFPVFQEGVVAAQGVYFGVVGVGTGGSRFFYRASYLLGGEEPVAGDAYEEHLGRDARVGLFLGLVAIRNVVEIHGPRKVEVGVGIEAAGELSPLVVQVALDLESPAELGVQRGTPGRPPAEPLPLTGGALVGHHPRHSGDG